MLSSGVTLITTDIFPRDWTLLRLFWSRDVWAPLIKYRFLRLSDTHFIQTQQKGISLFFQSIIMCFLGVQNTQCLRISYWWQHVFFSELYFVNVCDFFTPLPVTSRCFSNMMLYIEIISQSLKHVSATESYFEDQLFSSLFSCLELQIRVKFLYGCNTHTHFCCSSYKGMFF